MKLPTVDDFENLIKQYEDMKFRLHVDAIRRVAQGDNDRYYEYTNKDVSLIDTAITICRGVQEVRRKIDS